MDIIQTISKLFENNDLLKLVSGLFSSNQSATPPQTDYYKMPSYSFDPKANQVAPQNIEQNESGFDIKSIVSIVGTLLQFLNNKKSSSATEDFKNDIEISPSKIEQYTRVE